MNLWILKVELNGEWEECHFPTQRAALRAFVALAQDYKKALKRAILFTRREASARLLPSSHPRPNQRLVN
jgi:hypothetical protein